jgi:uncharacterized OsmC-like protein
MEPPALDEKVASDSVNINVDGADQLYCDLQQSEQAAPKELLYSSLASCTVLTIEHYLRHSKLSKSPSITALFQGLHIVAVECRVVEIMGLKDAHVPVSLHMVVTLRVKEKATKDGNNYDAPNGELPLSLAQQAALLRVSKFCPVKRMLDTSVSVNTSIRCIR